MRLRNLLAVGLVVVLGSGVLAQEKEKKDKADGDEVFTGPVPVLRLEIPAEGMAVLRDYHYVWRQPRPERIDVKSRVREAGQGGQAGRIYSDVGIHLKGSYSYQPIDSKPSLTLNFDKFVPGQTFHGLSKIHLNNSVQDYTGLCEQLARELYRESGIPAPRATPALVYLNGRSLGLCVLVEGANKSFVKRAFGAKSAKGNLYDGGSGGDITKDLGLLAGEEPAQRADLKALAEATREADPAKRLKQLEEVLDVERFITFAAIEAILVHWDGYAIGCNNYRLFSDPVTRKMIFLPHGADQLFGTSNTPEMSLTPAFKGIVAKALFTVPEVRGRYLRRIEELSKGLCSVESLHARVDRLAKRLSAALNDSQRGGWEQYVQSLKERISQRGASVAQQLGSRPRPVRFAEDGTADLGGNAWRFKRDSNWRAHGVQMPSPDGRPVMRMSGTGVAGAGGTWRTTVLLEAGKYELSGRVRTRGIAAAEANEGPTGVMLRVSGETSTDGIVVSDEWKEVRYAFEVKGVEDIELVAEFRGPVAAMAEFDVRSMKLRRIKGD